MRKRPGGSEKREKFFFLFSFGLGDNRGFSFSPFLVNNDLIFFRPVYKSERGSREWRRRAECGAATFKTISNTSKNALLLPATPNCAFSCGFWLFLSLSVSPSSHARSAHTSSSSASWRAG